MRYTKPVLIAALLSFTTLSIAKTASAATGCATGTTCTHYNGTNCLSSSSWQGTSVGYSGTSMFINGTSQGICPVVKTTSFMGMDTEGSPSDALDAVYMNVTAPNGMNSFSCDLKIFQANIQESTSAGMGVNNFIADYPATWSRGAGQSGNNWTITFAPSSSPVINWLQDPTDWFYAQIDCTMPDSASGAVLEYWVAEEGNQDHTQYIYPSSACTFNGSSTSAGYQIVNGSQAPGSCTTTGASPTCGPHGYMESLEFEGGAFSLNCNPQNTNPNDFNNAVAIMIGPSSFSDVILLNDVGSAFWDIPPCMNDSCPSGGFAFNYVNDAPDMDTWSGIFSITSASGSGDMNWTSWRTWNAE